MHGKMGATFLKRNLQLLDKQTLATDLRERLVEDLIAARGHAEELHGKAGNYTLKF